MKNHTLSLKIGPPTAGLRSHNLFVLLRLSFVKPHASSSGDTLLVVKPLREKSRYTDPLNRFPPSFGITLVTVPPNICSAVPPPVTTLIS